LFWSYGEENLDLKLLAAESKPSSTFIPKIEVQYRYPYSQQKGGCNCQRSSSALPLFLAFSVEQVLSWVLDSLDWQGKNGTDGSSTTQKE
jgi:hypothetical protein